MRGATLIGSGPEVLRTIDRVGNDLGFALGTCGKDGQGVPVSDAQPTLRIPELTVGGTAHRMTADSAPLRFGGDAATVCRLLGGPTRDLNLMLRGIRGGMFAVAAGQPWRPRAAQCGLFAVVAGRCTASSELAVPARSLLWFDEAPASLTFVPDAAGAATVGWWLAATPQEHAAWA